MVGYIKFSPSWGKVTTRYKKLVYFTLLHKKSKAAIFIAPVRPPLGTIGESIAAIRRFHSLRSFHQRLFIFAPFGDGRTAKLIAADFKSFTFAPGNKFKRIG